MNTLDGTARRVDDGIRIQLIDDRGCTISALISDANAAAIRDQLDIALRIAPSASRLPPDPVRINPPSRL